MYGTAPSVIEVLNEVELASISMVRNVVHIFSYFGGEAKLLKGWHSIVQINYE